MMRNAQMGIPKRKRRLSLFVIMIAMLVTSVTGVFVANEEALACGWPGERTGYFYCRGISTSAVYDVIQGGLPTWITTKDQFINHFEAMVYAGTYNQNNVASHNKLGAAYIIQTMRGGTDHDFPDSADIADWKARINNPNVSVQWDYQRANINSARRPFFNGVRDIHAYAGDNALYRSFTFYEGSTVRYILKQACANPLGGLSGLPDPVNYNLDPTIGVDKTSAEGGEGATLSPAVNNSGATTSASVSWQLTTFRVDPGGTIPTGGINATAPNQHYGNNAAPVQPAQSRAFGRGTTSLASLVGQQQIGDFRVGTRVCYALSVRPYTHTNGTNWRHSAPACIVIAKKPKVQVLGGDLIVGKGGGANIVTSSSTKTVGGSARTFGSWGEYAIFASGQVTSMASGAGYSGGAPGTTTCSLSLLTFSNVRAGGTSCNNGDRPGGYANVSALPDVGSRLVPQNTLPANSSVNIYDTNTGSYSASGTVSVNSSQAVPRGRWVVINAPTATVNITGNIEYTGESLNSLADIPQVVIIANRINIAASVTRVDAWLIASGRLGSLYTCSDVPLAANLTSNLCNQQLTVNGPVIARHLYLHRTAGSDGNSSGEADATQAGRPAEIFNLRPDAYLWATGYTAGAGRMQTVMNTELPPRF